MTPPENCQTSLLSILSSDGALTKDALIITKQGHISRTSDADLSDISNCAGSKAVWGSPHPKSEPSAFEPKIGRHVCQHRVESQK